jgi:hypothetical protein
MTYERLLDYLGDQRQPERLTVPPGGDCDCANSYLVGIADQLRGVNDPVDQKRFLRAQAATLSTLPAITHLCGPALKRLAEWCDEISAGAAQ